jgi:hypothetical protein
MFVWSDSSSSSIVVVFVVIIIDTTNQPKTNGKPFKGEKNCF